MLLECSCGKMYRVRDDAAHPPTKCPSCGGVLRQHSGAAPAAPAGPDPKVKDLEARLQAAERGLSSAKASAELKDKELREAQAAIGRLGGDLEKAQASYREALRKKEAEVEERQRKLDELEKEGTKVRQQSQTQTTALLRQKDAALQEARDEIARLEERLAQPAPAGSVPAEVEARLKELEAEVETGRDSRAKLVEELGREKDAFRDALKAKVSELEAAEARAADLEKKLTEPEGDPKTPSEERARMRIRQLEKIVQDGERRYRDLLARTEQEGGAAAPAAPDSGALSRKEAELAQARSALEAEKARREGLERQVADLQAAKKAPPPPTPAKGGEVLRARIGEARYLSGDLEKSLGSVSTSLQALIERVKRLQGSLEAPEEEPAPEPAAEAAPAREGPYAPAGSGAEVELEPPAELVHEAAAVDEEPREEVAQLEALPEPEPAAEGVLPADETLLDMGGVKRGGADADEAPVEAASDETPLSAEPSPEPPLDEAIPEPAPEAPKKKGFFGKLFGKK